MLAAAASAATQDVCRALVMSGGGNNGAWEAGAIYGFVNNGNPADFAYDVVTGVSAGSINTAAFSAWEVGREVEFAQWLSDIFKNLKTSDIWVDWKFGKVEGLTLKQGAVDNSPMTAFLTSILEQFDGFKRRVTLAAVNVNDGTFTEFDQTNIEFMELANAATASSSIPGAFPPYNWPGRGLFMDGGTVYNINVEGAVKQCLELVDDTSKIIMDIFVCNAPEDPV